MRTALAVLGVAVVAVAACAWQGCEPLDFGCDDLSAGMLEGPAGMVLTEEEHATGWGRSRCLSCHSVERIHVLNCTGVEEIDLAAIRGLVAEGGEASCVDCHGDNGVVNDAPTAHVGLDRACGVAAPRRGRRDRGRG